MEIAAMPSAASFDLHGVEKVLDGGFDEKLGLDAEPAADFLPQLDAESLQLAAFVKHERPDRARGHPHGGHRSLRRSRPGKEQKEQRSGKTSHGPPTVGEYGCDHSVHLDCHQRDPWQRAC